MTMPKRNAFDGVYGYNADCEMGFINFKKLGKFVKKSARKIGKVAKKVVKAPIKAVRKIGKSVDLDFIQAGKWTGQKIKENPALAIGLAAGGAALTFGGAPLLIAGLKGGAGMIKAGAGMIGGAAKAAIPTAASIGNKMMPHVKNHFTQVGQQALNDGERVGLSPQYQEAVEKLRAQGYTEAQIAQQWMTSQAYYKQAVPEVQRSVYPEVYQQYAAQMPEQQAAVQAHRDSAYIAEETVKDVQKTASGTMLETMVIPAALLSAAFLFI